jgi:hypothetical protein
MDAAAAVLNEGRPEIGSVCREGVYSARFTKANSRPTTLVPDYITNDSGVGVFADDQARVDQPSSWSPGRS